MQRSRNIIISIGVCLIGLLFVACSGSLESTQVSQATIEATAIERSTIEATTTKRPTIKVTASFTRTPRTPTPTCPPNRPTRTIALSPTPNTTPVADLLGLPATPITLSSSAQAECYPRISKTSPDGQYSASFMGEGVEILDKERLRIYHVPYRVSDFMFSPDSSQLAFKVYLNPDNWSIFIVNLDDGVLRQAFHVSELPNYSKSEGMNLQEWNSAGILIDLYDSDAEKPFSYELFDPNSSQFETIGFGYMSFVIGSMVSHNGRFIMQSRDNPEPPDSEGNLIFLFDRENNTEHFIVEGTIRLSGFSSDDRYFAYSHFIENGKYRVILLDLDTMTSKELVLDQSLGHLRSVEWYGEEQKLLLTIDHKTGFIKYLLPIDNFDLDHLDLDHLTRLPNTP